MHIETDENPEINVLQADIMEQLDRFAKENPEIAAALSVMNMTLPQYMEAIENLHGGTITPVSAYTHLPVQAHL